MEVRFEGEVGRAMPKPVSTDKAIEVVGTLNTTDGCVVVFPPRTSGASWRKSMYLAGPGQPAELASIYVQLAANDASFATGNIYGSGGGQGQP